MGDELDKLSIDLDLHFNVSDPQSQTSDLSKPHPKFSSYYKNSGRSSLNQNKRRVEILQRQKKSRDGLLTAARAMALIEDNDEEEEEDKMDLQTSAKSKKAKPPNNIKNKYRNQLMLSEWLVEVPEAFETDWIMMMCPEGKRNLVVAGGGRTRYFTRSGYYLGSFASALPGGRKFKSGKITSSSPTSSSWKKRNFTVLDCIYSEKTDTFYVLDVMVWDGNSYYDCDTDFRFFWARTKLFEANADKRDPKTNPYPFLPAQSFACDRETMTRILSTHNEPVKDEVLDGVLFYHRGAHYIPGPTPLVGWLKGYMIPELLDVPVSASLIAQRPDGYATMKSYIDDENSKKKDIFTFKMESPTITDVSFEKNQSITALTLPLTPEKVMEF